MKKNIFNFISIGLLLVSCSLEQDPLASFPKEIREGILPGDDRVLKPIPRGAIQINSLPSSPLVLHNEVATINIEVHLLQNFQAPYVVDILNLDSLPGKASFDAKKNQIHWTPDLSKLQDLFEYIPIHIRVSFEEPQSLYIEHTIYARAYRTLLGLKLEKITTTNFLAGSKNVAKVVMIVKDLDVNLKLGSKTASTPHLMITQGSKKNFKYLLPYLKFLPKPKLKRWNDSSTWVIEAHFNLEHLKLTKKTTFYFAYEVFSSFGKSFGLQTRKIFIKPNIIITPPTPKPLPAPPQPPKKSKTAAKATAKTAAKTAATKSKMSVTNKVTKGVK